MSPESARVRLGPFRVQVLLILSSDCVNEDSCECPRPWQFVSNADAHPQTLYIIMNQLCMHPRWWTSKRPQRSGTGMTFSPSGFQLPKTHWFTFEDTLKWVFDLLQYWLYFPVLEVTAWYTAMYSFSPSNYLFPGPEVFLLELGQNCIYVLCFKMLNLYYFVNVFTFFLHHQQVCDSKKNILRSTEYCECTVGV